MLIVIKDADFSANNVGKVSVPKKLDNFTLKALEASHNTGLAEDKKQALNTFFSEMGAFGSESNLWSKFDMVYLPFLVSGMEYSLMKKRAFKGIWNVTVVDGSDIKWKDINYKNEKYKELIGGK